MNGPKSATVSAVGYIDHITVETRDSGTTGNSHLTSNR